MSTSSLLNMSWDNIVNSDRVICKGIVDRFKERMLIQCTNNHRGKSWHSLVFNYMDIKDKIKLIDYIRVVEGDKNWCEATYYSRLFSDKYYLLTKEYEDAARESAKNELGKGS